MIAAADGLDAIVGLAPDGRIEALNSAAEQTFGAPAAALVGRPADVLIAPACRRQFLRLIDHVAKGEPLHLEDTLEMDAIRNDGATFPVELRLSRPDGEARLTVVIRDISERRSLHRRLVDVEFQQRTTLARELHDAMSGQVAGAALLAQTLQTQLERQGSPQAPRAADLVRALEGLQFQLRTITRDLMPVEPVPEGLMVALENFAEQCRATYGIACVFRADPPVYVEDPIVAKHLFRIVQEAVTNSTRHGKARHLDIRLSREHGSVILAVADDGVGLRGQREPRGGVGMFSMRRRADAIAGQIDFDFRSDGTVVTCTVPSSRVQRG